MINQGLSYLVALRSPPPRLPQLHDDADAAASTAAGEGGRTELARPARRPTLAAPSTPPRIPRLAREAGPAS